MAIIPARLAEFATPPVVEVALDVQFNALLKLRGAQLGLLWSALRDRFPVVEEQNALVPLPEDTAGTETTSVTRIELSVLDTPPVPRMWFTNASGSELVQVQQDRFIVNWRKIDGDAEYPRYGYVRSLFQEYFELFQDFLIQEKLGEVIPTQCAVTYYNHIAAGDGWERHGQLDKVFSEWKAPAEAGPLPEPDDVRLAVRYPIPDDAGGPLGRLYVEVQPAFRKPDNNPIYVMTVTARGGPEGEGLQGVLQFLDRGHQWASRAFTALTTPEMHETWGAKA